MPGAGRSTLLARRLPATARVLDPEPVRAPWRRWQGTSAGYQLLRPLVHGEHWARVLVALLRPGPVVVHHCATARGTRHALLALARVTGRSAHLLVLDAGPREALAGQHARGRVVRPAVRRRHAARWAGLRAALAAGADVLRREGWASWTVLDRGEAERVAVVSVG